MSLKPIRGDGAVKRKHLGSYAASGSHCIGKGANDQRGRTANRPVDGLSATVVAMDTIASQQIRIILTFSPSPTAAAVSAAPQGVVANEVSARRSTPHHLRDSAPPFTSGRPARLRESGSEIAAVAGRGRAGRRVWRFEEIGRH
jgi:hypothetical protein